MNSSAITVTGNTGGTRFSGGDGGAVMRSAPLPRTQPTGNDHRAGYLDARRYDRAGSGFAESAGEPLRGQPRHKL